jgi:AcrR family transcriptional regulator
MKEAIDLEESIHTDKTKGEVTKEKIFAAAVDLFSHYGYNGVSIRDITGRVGIKESTLYHYYESKHSLLSEMYDYFIANLSKAKMSDPEMSEKMTQHDGYLLLKHCLDLYRKVMEAPLMAKIWRIVTMEQFRDPRAFSIISVNFNKSRFQYYEKIFRAMVKAKMIQPIDTELLAHEYIYAFIGMFSEYNILKYYGKPVTELEKRMSEHIKFFWHRIKNS